MRITGSRRRNDECKEEECTHYVRQPPATVLLVVLGAAVCVVNLAVLMLGPMLVVLSHEFHTSVAIVGQLAAATAITWMIVALLAGPVAEAYGQRRTLLTGCLLMTLGMLGSALAWDYASLFVLRLLTGIGAALVTPNSIAAVAEVVPLSERGRLIGLMMSATGVSAAVGVPLVSFLLDAGGWRLPFAVIGATSLLVWLLLWVWLPPFAPWRGRPSTFFTSYRTIAAVAGCWYILVVNALQQTMFFGVFGYLAAYLMQTYRLSAGGTALPLVLAGVGVMVGSFLGGRIADDRRRLAWFALSCCAGGLLATLVFAVPVSPWVSVALAFGAAALARVSSAVTPTLLLELAEGSRSTASGLFVVSNQLGAFSGPAVGGLALALGGFPSVGLFCLVMSICAALLIQLKVQRGAAALPPIRS